MHKIRELRFDSEKEYLSVSIISNVPHALSLAEVKDILAHHLKKKKKVAPGKIEFFPYLHYLDEMRTSDVPI